MKYDCKKQFLILARGKISSWQGLSEKCSIGVAESVFGSHGKGPVGIGELAGELTSFHYLPKQKAAPIGITIWLESDKIILIQINEYKTSKKEIIELGQPAFKRKSNLKSYLIEWIYPGKGLIFHISKRNKKIFRLYAFIPVLDNEFDESWLNQIDKDYRKKRN